MEAEEATMPPLYVMRRRRVVNLPRRRHASRRQEPILSPPLKQLMKYGVPAAMALLTLRHQAKPDALFGENAAALWCFVAATAVYWLVVGAMAGRARYGEILRRAALAFGVQSSLSLLSMFLPNPISLLPLLIPIIPLALFLAYAWIRPPIITIIIDKMKTNIIPRRLNPTTNPPQTSPV